VNTIRIPEKEILRDFFFRFSGEADLSGLIRSVGKSGVWNPLRVRPLEEGFQIVSGFRRFQAALSAGLHEVPCCVLSESTPLGRHFEEAVLEQISCRSLHLVEKARIIAILRSLETPSVETESRFAVMLELPAGPGKLDAVGRLLDLHPDLLRYLEGHPVSLKQAAAFVPLDRDAQASLAAAGRLLRIRIVELSEILGWIKDIARRGGVSVSSAWADCGIPAILEDAGTGPGPKLEAVKTSLRLGRFPELSGRNVEAAEIRAGLSVPPGIKIAWDPTLESSGLSFECRIVSAVDIEKAAAFLTDAAVRAKLVSLLNAIG
jgi:hypothetical protein